MTLAKKTLLVCSISLLALTALLFFVSQVSLYQGLSRLEMLRAQEKVGALHHFLDYELQGLESQVKDWAYWDDSYHFALDQNPQYIEDNLAEEVFTNLEVNLVVFFSPDGQVIWRGQFGELVDSTPDRELDISWPAGPDQGDAVSGIMLVNDFPLIFSLVPILTSDRQGPSSGYLLMARSLQERVLQRYAALDTLSVEAFPLGSLGSPEAQLAEQLATGPEFTWERVGQEQMAIYSLLSGFDGEPLLLVQMAAPNDMYSQGVSSIRLFLGGLLVCGLLIAALLALYIHQTVFRRITAIGVAVSQVTLQGDLAARIECRGHDELAQLGKHINHMLEWLQVSRGALTERERRLRYITDNMRDIILEFGRGGELRYASPSVTRALGYEIDEVLGQDTDRFVHPDDLPRVRAALETVKPNGDMEPLQLRIRCKDGDYLWMEVVGRFVQDGDEIVSSIFSCRDITERKAAEAELRYMSIHDSLTGLYNRVYYERYLEQVDTATNLPISIVMCDINGLKLINDRYGFDSGDRVLKNTARFIQQTVGHRGLVSRISGDQFAVVMPKTPPEAASRLFEELRAGSRYIDAPGEGILLAIGISCKQSELQKMDEVVRRSEERMYRNKMLEPASVRSATMFSLQRTLGEKTQETEEHAIRLSRLALKVGRMLGLAEGQLDELTLVSLLHDIGKVAIPDHILTKPGPLTDEEWQIMQTHCEIGARICRSSPDLISVAEPILSHHERWDGSGYPRRLKGTEIPLAARILSIVDAYDVMTAGRSYKGPISKDKALEELQRCAGTQFDPELVKVFVSLVEHDEEDDIHPGQEFERRLPQFLAPLDK